MEMAEYGAYLRRLTLLCKDEFSWNIFKKFTSI